MPRYDPTDTEAGRQRLLDESEHNPCIPKRYRPQAPKVRRRPRPIVALQALAFQWFSGLLLEDWFIRLNAKIETLR